MGNETNNSMALFKTRLRELRGDKSLKTVADDLGISRASLGYYENGDRTPDIEILVRMAHYFQVSSDYLLGITDTPTPDIENRAITEKTGLTEEAISWLYMNKRKASGEFGKEYRIYKDDEMYASYWLDTVNELLSDTYGGILYKMVWYLYSNFDEFAICGTRNSYSDESYPISDLELIDRRTDFAHSIDDDDYDLSKIFLLEIEEMLTEWKKRIRGERE